MKENRAIFLFPLALIVMLISDVFAASKPAPQPVSAAKFTPRTVDLRLTQRDLWVGHIFWVRNVVLAAKQGDAAAARTADEQAVKNAREIANAFLPYYGREASDKLFGLLAAHYGAIRQYMDAVFGGNSDGQTAASDELKKNADDIAVFLGSANPNWQKDTLLSALVAHAGHHMAQIDNVNANDFAAEAKTWDAMRKHVYVISDVLADGIVKQFPNKF